MKLSRPAGAQIVAASRSRAGKDASAAPVEELEGTVAGFQAILTDDDRKKLQQLKTMSLPLTTFKIIRNTIYMWLSCWIDSRWLNDQ